MPWEQTVSASFRARHDSADVDAAHAILQSLERTRELLRTVFPNPLGELTVVVHAGRAALALSNPLILARWVSASPSSRRLIAGWAGAREIHVLAPAAPDVPAEEASDVREALRLSAAALYVRRAAADQTRGTARMFGPARRLRLGDRELRWAWLLEGSSRWLAGQYRPTRAAIALRLSAGPRPRFPPGLRDAPLLGSSVCELLAERAGGGTQGARAVARLATRPGPGGPQAALERAFDQRLVSIEGEWRTLLSRLGERRRS